MRSVWSRCAWASPASCPPIVVNPPPAASDTAPPSATTPNRSRRKRSQNKGSSSSIASKKSPSSESSSSLQRAEKSPVVAKDLPPHLAPPPPPETPSFDIKHNIDALVERVRAVAMDRPHTPGSHIDWAGDEDDSLPDLDDWGVPNVNDKSNATSSASAQADLISPILADALKPLPNLEFGSPRPATGTFVKSEDSDHTPRGEPEAKNAKEGAHVDGSLAKNTESTKSGSGPGGQKTANAHVNDREDKSQAPKLPEKPRAPLHPSLPPKPVATMGDAPKRGSRRPSIPAVKTGDAVPAEESAKSSAIASADAPKPDEPVDRDESPKESSPEREGLAASMHAPKPSAIVCTEPHSRRIRPLPSIRRTAARTRSDVRMASGIHSIPRMVLSPMGSTRSSNADRTETVSTTLGRTLRRRQVPGRRQRVRVEATRGLLSRASRSRSWRVA
ncbi:hypothetical protein NUW54_g10204 [Trametes sanguinea]|uniref:Uncharacterized protein n=1 Tax=Trametes sanguinea TaxID=158606 RepID=A0ACC1P278_9APHY|nr:hypothetical protein NUW54_g10204 [Trametes sanguinea]